MKVQYVYENLMKPVMAEIYAEDRKRRSKAAFHVKRAIKKKINKTGPSLPGEAPGKVTGNLIRGLQVQNLKTVSLVGFVAPAYHANLLEFGTKGGERMAKRPIIAPTMVEEAAAVKQILSGGEWV